MATDVNDSRFTAGGVQSLDISGNVLATAVQSAPKTQTRASAILMYQITNPLKPRFVQYVRNTTDLSDGDISPEGLKFIPAAQSPSGVPLLVVGHEVTGSVAVYQIR